MSHSKPPEPNAAPRDASEGANDFDQADAGNSPGSSPQPSSGKQARSGRPNDDEQAAGETRDGGETRDEELQRLRREADEANKHALQAQADAENFRKRMRRDLEDQLRFASLPLISDLLQVRDNLFRALDAASAGDAGAPPSALRDGVAMCAKQLDDVLAKHGVSEIPAAGETFDPNVHEAISQIPSETHEAGTVAHVAVVGFRLHDRVIRPSQVVVSSGPSEPATETP